MRTIKTISCLILAAISWRGAKGQTDTSQLGTLSLKELLNVKITTASKTTEELDKAAATVIVITADQIKMRGYRSLLDVLYDLPEMKVDDKLYTLSLNNFTVRGIPGQDKFILLLDGVRISSPTNEPMPIMENYPVNLAEQIEVVYGPASALYGADAVSGVINIITKKVASKKGISVEASSTAGMYGMSDQSLFIAKKLGDHSNFVVSGQYFYDRQPDYTRLYGKTDTLFDPTPLRKGSFNTIFGPMTPKAPVGQQYGATMSAYNIYSALHLDDFSIALFSNYSRTPTAFSDNTNNNVYNDNVYVGQHINMANASYEKSFSHIVSTSTLMASEYSMDPGSNIRNVYSNMEPNYMYSTGSMSKLEEQVDWKIIENLDLTAGLSYASYNSVPRSSGLDDPINKDSYLHGIYQGTETYYRPGGLPAQIFFIKYHNTGSYFQVQYAPLPKINFTLGVRDDINSRYGETLNPRLGMVYKPSDQTTIKALYGSAFLAPSPVDTYENFGSIGTSDSGRTFHSNFMHLPNPDLKPVTSQNAEFSIHQYFSDDLSVTIDGYYTLLKNLHAFADDNQTSHIYNNRFAGATVDFVEITVNQGQQRSWGGSAQLNYKNQFGRIKINAYVSLDYTGGHILTNGTHVAELENISSYIFHIGADLKAGRFTCSPRLMLEGKQHLTGLSDTTMAIYRRQTIPGYALLNISLSYTVAKRFNVFATIHNALDQRYRNVGSDMDLKKAPTETFYGVHEDPIRVIGGISFNF